MPEVSPLPPGSVLDDRYRIDELLSVGGMGAVYAGHHVNLDKRVAIKVLRTDVPGVNLLDRFRREAQAASAIGHENIVQVTDMGTAPDGTAYLVMELLEGASLGDLLRAEAPLSVGRACRIACEILRGVDAAHGAGIIHRDIKPDNVFLARAGGSERETVKLLDFGVSLLERLDVPDARLTSTGALLGTPRYMSPEQARGQQDVTAAVDLYAIGVVLYEMLTGLLPYSGENYNLVIYEIIAGDWVPIEKHRPDLPAEIVAAVQRALALSPAERFASADEMRAILGPFASEPGAAAPAPPRTRPEHSPVALAPTEVSAPAQAAATSPRMESAPVVARRGRGGLALGLGLLVIAAASVAIYVAVRERRGAEPATSAPATRTETSPAPIAAPVAPPRPAAPPVTDPAPAPPKAPARPDEPDEPASQPRPAGEPPPGARREGEVIIMLTTVPADAIVTIDDTPLVGRRLAITRDTSPIEMQVQAPGHAPRTVEIVPDRDRNFEVRLRPLSPGAASVDEEHVEDR